MDNQTKTTLEHKGYRGSVEYSEEDKVFFGKVENINGLVSYEGETIAKLEEDFRGAIEDYEIIVAGMPQDEQNHKQKPRSKQNQGEA